MMIYRLLALQAEKYGIEVGQLLLHPLKKFPVQNLEQR